MHRSTIIATCLLNSKMVQRLEDGERAVRTIFAEEHPNEDFAVWNELVSNGAANHVINGVGKASRINVAKFIDDLRDAR